MVKHKKFVGWDFYEGWAFPNFVGRPKLLKTFWRKLPEHLKNNRPINAHLNFQEQKVAVFRDFLHFFISLILYIFFWIFGIFWEFPKSQEFPKILWIFRDWDPTLFGKNPMEFKIPGIGILFRGIGIFHEKATSAHKLRFVTKNLGIVTLSQ